MQYTILKSKPQHYQVRLIDVALQIVAKYHLQLCSNCRESPRIPNMPAEEVVSELLIDRMPRFLQNYRRDEFEAVKECVTTDLTAAQNDRALEYNLQSFRAEIKRLQNASTIDRKEVLRIQEQLLYLKHLRTLVKVEKRLLTYLRSCVRRTKLKYLKAMWRENQISRTADPTNGMLGHQEGRRDFDDRTRLKELFDLLGVEEEDRVILERVILEGVLFKELAAELYASRQTAARRYQLCVKKFRRLLREYLEDNPHSNIVSGEIKRKLLGEIND